LYKECLVKVQTRYEKRGLKKGSDNSATIAIKNNLAVLLKKMNRFKESSAYLRECLRYRGMENKIFIDDDEEDDDDDGDGGDKTQDENNISDRNNNNTGAASLSSKASAVNNDSKNVNESNANNTNVEYDADSLNIMNNLACLYDSEATQEKDVSIFFTFIRFNYIYSLSHSHLTLLSSTLHITTI